jgi:hypothetical protein
MQIADIDEWNIAGEPQRAQDRYLGVAGVETVDLVQRCFDGKHAMMIDRGGATEICIALEHQDLVSGAGKQRRRRQATESGSDRNGIEVAGHPLKASRCDAPPAASPLPHRPR